MTRIHAEAALLPQGWARNVLIRLDGARIAAIETERAAEPGDARCGVVVPSLGNLHSHAFQRAMAGLAELRGPADDSFWSWRTIMYRMALTMTPEQVEAVAAQLYVEMLEAGFTRVGEFHYLHHDRDGRPYADPAEMAGRIAAASAETGIGLTLLPVFYAHAGFGGLAPAEGQRRFIHRPEAFAELMARCRSLTRALPGAHLGLAPHSLRAVTPEELADLLPLAEGGPVHIHVAEQVKEVEDSLAFSGARPVEWLLANMPVDDRWCLIHATHMTQAEVRGMAARGAVAGLCPITEANLGDGVFEAPLFLAEGGRFGVGSDSNVLISLPEELRMLEYSQRLARRARNVIAPPGGSTGRHLLETARIGGNAALQSAIGLVPGGDADFVALDSAAVPYLEEDRLIDHWIFAGGVRLDRVWAGGRCQVEGGRHRARDAVRARFEAAMAQLVAAL
ncbi:formimidoylglutamate deiminase [Rhizobium rhizosphaerae]|uniref:Formimidoylglutamate deiminase n=1 Tax=Xaviernesmea rhizosphaerae TaxID=1672749 RepID=A0A1Q9AKF2_9HYPH|nr:formimidoylglutamate deiminase [Xaviernesmea rhizosphaerae]OLP55758.1 formimidoylglutamate deiminase [Xaviernesmea rhizosphaerae]